MADSPRPADANIHPSLRFLHSSPEHPSEETLSDDDDDLPPANSIQQTNNDPVNPTSNLPMTATGAPAAGSIFLVDLTPFSQFVKANMELSEESMLKLDNFCSPHALEERLAMLYATVLVNQDMLRGMRKTVSKTWELSSELKNKIWSYVRVFLLSPNLSSYRGDIATSILRTMRELQVQGLPPDTEPTRVTAVLSLARKHLTQFRATIKEKVLLSQTPDGVAIKNIGDLASSLIKNTEIPRTQDLYMRLAFLRFLMSSESGINLDDDELFWLHVDDTIETYRNTGEAQMTQSLNTCYVADKKKYGEPLGDGHQTVGLDSVVPWIKLINKNARSIAKGVATASRKRRRHE